MNQLLSATQIQQRVAQLAEQIGDDYQDKSLTIVGVLTGCLFFVADTIRHLDLSLQIGFIQASSYRGNATVPANLEIYPQLLPAIKNQDVLLMDDILDTGQTLCKLIEYLEGMGPSSLRTAVLLRKKSRQKIAVEADYCGFDIPDKFVIGYGLDYNDQYRHLPYIAELSDEELKEPAV